MASRNGVGARPDSSRPTACWRIVRCSVAVSVRVALGELGFEQVAHQVVQVQARAGMARRRAGTRATPTPPAPAARPSRRAGPRWSGTRGRRSPGRCGGRRRARRGRARGRARPRDAAPVGQVGGRATRRRRLGEQRERERMATAELRQPAALVSGTPSRPSSSRSPPASTPPGRAGAAAAASRRRPTTRRRRLPTGQHDDRVRGQRRQQLLAEPPVERCEQLIPVDEQHRPRAVGTVATAPTTSSMDPPSPGRAAAAPAAGLRRAAAHLVEQCGLADAAGTVHEQHPGRAVPASAAPNEPSSGARPTKPSLRASSRAPDSVSPTPRA